MRHRRPLTQSDKDLIAKQQVFSAQAREREECYKKEDKAFIAEYQALCLKHKRYIGGLTMHGTLYHEKDIKKIKDRFANINFNWAYNGRPKNEFYVYNR